MIELSERLVAFAVLLQSIEYIQVRSYFGKNGVWVGPELQAHLWIRLLIAVTTLVMPSGVLLILLSLSTMLIALRMRGTFNGGSDMMTGLACLCLGLNRLGVPFFLHYLLIQVVASYCVAGIGKLRSHRWRDGSILTYFASARSYAAPIFLKKIADRPKLARAAAWSILLFECLFPLALLNQTTCLIVLALGAGFHLANAFVFGLNRFFWIWIATYPLLLLFAKRL